MYRTWQLSDECTRENDCERFSRPGYKQKYVPFLDVAHNKGHASCVPSNVENVQFNFGADPICRYGDIHAGADTGSRRVLSGESRVVAREVRNTTTASLLTSGFGVCKPNSVDRTHTPWRS